MKRYAARLWAFFSVLCLLLPLAACGGNTGAATMHLTRTQGEVGVSDDAGKSVEPRENLGLYSGYGVDTRSSSYAWINLDDVKLAKMDQDTRITIEKEGKALEIEVRSGALFFNVTEPLADDETMNIRASTMLVGIRGTRGWVEDNGILSRVYLLEGKVECSAGDQTVQVNAGEMAELTEDGKLVVKPFYGEDIADFVRPEIEDDEELIAAFPASEFRSKHKYEYVDGSKLSSEAKELLLRILDAAKAENWDEAETLALSAFELENFADGVVRSDPEFESITFYSEFDNYRIYFHSADFGSGTEVKEDDDSLLIEKMIKIEIRPESGQGCYLDGSFGTEYYSGQRPYREVGYALGECENYNWTGSFAVNRSGYNRNIPALGPSHIENDLWND